MSSSTKHLVLSSYIPYNVRRSIPLLAVSLFLLIITGVKYSPLLGEKSNAGWDAPGHLHLHQAYANFFSNKMNSSGWDDRWFRGYPAFSFYPPMTYYLSSFTGLILPGYKPADLVPYHLTLWIYTIALAMSILIFSYIFLNNGSGQDAQPWNWRDQLTRGLYSLAASLFYLNFAGYGTHGVSIVGFIDGTYNSAPGVSLLFVSLAFLERFRQKAATGEEGFTHRLLLFVLHSLSTALSFYFHFLSGFFLFLILIAYYAFFFKDFRLRFIVLSFAIPVILLIPILHPLFAYSDLNQAASVLERYPFFLSMLGSDLYDEIQIPANQGDLIPALYVFLKYLILKIRWIQAGGLILFLFLAAKIVQGWKMPSLGFRFLFFLSIPLFTISTDISLSYFLPDFAVHWYRAFDAAYGIYGVLLMGTIYFFFQEWKTPSGDAQDAATAAKGSSPELFRVRMQQWVGGVTVLFVLLQFFLFDPWGHNDLSYKKIAVPLKKDRDVQELELALEKLPGDSLVFVEQIRQDKQFGSPHYLDYILQKYNLRNAGGLMVESSLSGSHMMIVANSAFRTYFVWGHNPISLLRQDFFPQLSSDRARESLYKYLENIGAEYVLFQSIESRATFQKDLATFEKKGEGHPIFKPLLKNQSFELYRLRSTNPQAFRGPVIGAVHAKTLEREKQSDLHYKLFPYFATVFEASTGIRAGNIVNLDPWFQKNKNTLPPWIDILVIYDSQKNKRHPGPHLPWNWDTENAQKPPVLLLNRIPFPDDAPFVSSAKLNQNGVMKPGVIRRDLQSAIQKLGKTENVSYRRDYDPIEQKIVLSPVAQPEETSKDSSGAASHTKCNRLFLHDSYYPDWSILSGEPIYQTGINGMFACAKKPSITLVYNSLFAGFTFWMLGGLLLSYVLVAGAWIVLWLRSER